MDKRILRWNFIFQYGYVLTNIINALILLPLYLKHIPSATLGVWLATGNILAWMTLADPGVGDVLQQKIAVLRGRNDLVEIRKTIGSGFIASAIIFVLALVAGFTFLSLASLIINKDIHSYPTLPLALVISVIATGFSLLSFSLSGINLGLQNSAQVAISSLVSNAIFLVLNIVLLLSGRGIVSIALANLARAVFINIYNMTTIARSQRKEGLSAIFDRLHFKKFIRIFSFTSAARIIGGFSASLDMIILARFVAPSMITVFEINKRPIQLTQSLVGRHSVALMPVLSHEKGKENTPAIISIIKTQFRLYSYLALFLTLLFCFNYEAIIKTWTGNNHYAGNQVMFLLVANFFVSLIGYFMANVGYALGDIKRNSMINVLKGIISAFLLYVMALHFGITGVLLAMLCMSFFVDFVYFTFRLYQLQYITLGLLRNAATRWVLLGIIGVFAGLFIAPALAHLLSPAIGFVGLIIRCGVLTVLYITGILATDKELRSMVVSRLRFFHSVAALKKT